MKTAQEHIFELFLQAFPPKLSGSRHVGPEEEYIVVSAYGERGDCTPLFSDLIKDGWKPKQDSITKTLVGVSMGDLEVGMDVGAGTLEIAFNHVENLLTHLPQRELILKLVDAHLRRHGLYRLQDYSVQPITQPAPEHWGSKGRSQFFRDYFSRDVDVQTASAASQVHIDVSREEVIPVLEILLSLSPVLTALSANAPVWGGCLDPKGLLAARQDFWNRFTLHTGHWSNVHVGLPRAFPPYLEQTPSSLQELVKWITQTRFLVHVDGDRIISPQTPFQQWYDGNAADMDEAALRACYLSHEGTLWWEVRPRVAYGTIEVRPCCQNSRAINVDAFVLGLIENWETALNFVRSTKTFLGWRRLHQDSLKDGLRVHGIQEVARQTLEIARNGLRKRGFGEEQLLNALERSIETLSSPGHEKKRIYENQGIESLVDYLLSTSA